MMTRVAIDRNDDRRQSLQAASRIIKRSIAAAVMVGACALLASCAGASNEDGFSAFVADHWPHWAGGMPNDVPPRPGAPGYKQFIAHGQADQDVLPPASANAPAAPATPVFQTAPSASPAAAEQGKPPQPRGAPAAPPSAGPVASAPPAPQPAAEDSSVVRGGLY